MPKDPLRRVAIAWIPGHPGQVVRHGSVEAVLVSPWCRGFLEAAAV
jgi:hypothetical protein